MHQYYNESDIRQWWTIAHKDKLDEGKTVRAVTFGPRGVFTLKRPIKSIDELLQIINKGYMTAGNQFGISVSAAEFDIVDNTAPNADAFVSTDTLVVDIDIHTAATGKDRVNLSLIEQKWIKFIAYSSHLNLYSNMIKNGIDWPVPHSIGVTGGGIQLIYKFDTVLRSEQSEKIFNLLKRYTPVNRYGAIAVNALGALTKFYLEFDKTSFDKQHVQRVLGTLNPKYNVVSYILHDYDPKNILDYIRSALLDAASATDNSATKNNLYGFLEKIDPLVKKAFTDNSNTTLNTKQLVSEARLNASIPILTRKGLTGVENSILTQLNGGKGFDLLLKDKINVEKENYKLIAIKCPFHEGDDNYSFAIYKNGDTPTGIDVFMDFHDQKKYNLIEFYAKIMGISKADAVREIVDLTGIKIAKTEKSELKKLEAAEESEQLVDKIDVDNFIYYRMADKQKNCIIRHIDSGKTYTFDGLKSLVRQILKDQLYIEEISREFLDAFTEIFEAKILIDGFERFAPGKEPVFKENGISLINLWVPTKNFKIAKNKASELLTEHGRKYTLEEAILEIKNKCPNTNIFLHQIVQYGSLEWFVNWLTVTTQFKTSPTIPFHYGNYGTGKNLFIDTIMEWYLNSEYVHIVGSDEITKQFNSFLQQSSLVVIDESNLYDSKSVDTLKMLSGNRRIKIEKKGIDTFDVDRYFNFMTFSNREVPAYINSQERRFTFFNTSIPLTATVEIMQTNIDSFITNVKEELEYFFGILLNTEIVKKWENMNIKDGTFYRVMFSGHSFGKLVLTILDNKWDQLILQLTENTSDENVMQHTMEMVYELKTFFEKTGKLPLALVNRYMESLNYKNRSSVSDFVRQNNLEAIIQTKLTREGTAMINLNVAGIRKLIETKNILIELYKEICPALKKADFKIEANCISNINTVIDFMQHCDDSNYEEQSTENKDESPPTGNTEESPVSLDSILTTIGSDPPLVSPSSMLDIIEKSTVSTPQIQNINPPQIPI